MKPICTILLWVGLLLGAAGLYFRITGTILFLILWIFGIGALNHYMKNGRRRWW